MFFMPAKIYRPEVVIPKTTTKYNKSEIMKQAHVLYRQGGYTQSEALRESWRLHKLSILERQLFMLRMKDRFDHEDWQEHNQLTADIRKLESAAVKRAA